MEENLTAGLASRSGAKRHSRLPDDGRKEKSKFCPDRHPGFSLPAVFFRCTLRRSETCRTKKTGLPRRRQTRFLFDQRNKSSPLSLSVFALLQTEKEKAGRTKYSVKTKIYAIFRWLYVRHARARYFQKDGKLR